MIRSQPDTFLINSSRLVKYRLTDQVLRKTWSSQFTFHANRIFPNSRGCTKEYWQVSNFSTGDPCAANPCLNGGTCAAGDNSIGFTCNCTGAYTSYNCGTEQGENNWKKNNFLCENPLGVKALVKSRTVYQKQNNYFYSFPWSSAQKKYGRSPGPYRYNNYNCFQLLNK